MEDRGVPRAFGKQRIHGVGVSQVDDSKLGAVGDRSPMTGAQVVDHHHAVAAFDQVASTRWLPTYPAPPVTRTRCAIVDLLPEVAAVARVVHLRIGIAGAQMDVDVHLRQGCANHVGVRFLQQPKSVRGDIARRGLPPHAEQCGVRKASDNARIRDRFGRWGCRAARGRTPRAVPAAGAPSMPTSTGRARWRHAGHMGCRPCRYRGRCVPHRRVLRGRAGSPQGRLPCQASACGYRNPPRRHARRWQPPNVQEPA